MAHVSDPIVINGHRLKNRLTFAPTVKFGWAGPDGILSDKHIAHYIERAEHGLGLLCVEATAVTPSGRFCEDHIGLWNDSQIEKHRLITEACRKNGVVSLIQLNHTGITTNPAIGVPVGPSAVPTRSGALAHEMTIEEIHAMQQAFTDAAVRAKKAGYDGIQLHGCHSYLINQFVAKKTNLRTDEYGGSDENRARFAAEIIRAVRKSCGPDFLISVRTVGADPDLEPCIAVAEEYLKAGCDYLQVSHGIEMPDESVLREGEPFNPIRALGVRFHEHFKNRVPVSCINSIFTPEDARYMLENDLVDTVDLARAVLADPRFPEAVLNGSPYVKCFECKRCQYGPFTKNLCPALLKREKENSGK
ncbi:MAG: NADH:flavin oxidoreductase [Lachnospiraceae bacterium]|nr:NADH:flavin oxidoreductase [Lachnospiraceae bacterium]